MNAHLYRLKAMAANDGQWDLSEKDIAAIKWAIQIIELMAPDEDEDDEGDR